VTLKDKVAIAAASTTGFVAKNLARSQASLAAEACIDVINKCGIARDEIDGLCGSWPSAAALQSVLGIPKLTWFGNPVIPLVDHVATAAAAVHAGLCEVVLVYHAAYRAAWNTGSALKDPFRRIATPGLLDPHPGPETMAAAVGYTGWASRYIYEYGIPREDFGLVALNSRAHAVGNPAAAMREPMTMDDYLSAPMIREPLCLHDMDVAVDGADAFIVTTTERAKDLALPPVLINAAVCDSTASKSSSTR
jgi:acetyl-CoA acetyltransferase